MEMDTSVELNNNQRVAIIDCGTNTFNLLVKEKVEGKWKTLFKTKLPVKLGAGGFSENILMPNRMARGLDALFSYKNVIDSLGVKDVRVFATSAVREASNGNEFVAKVKKHLNFDMEVISGDREAELIFEGVVQTTEEIKEDYLIMDIGGGSTEFIFVRDHKPLWRKSYLLGVSRLHGMLNPASRINQDDVHRLRAHLNNELQDLISFLKENPVRVLVGSSGSFDTLFDMYQFAKAKDSSKDVSQDSRKDSSKDVSQDSAKGFTERSTESSTEGSRKLNEIPFNAYPSVHQWLVGSTLEERLKHPSIPQMRAEYMPLSTYLVKFILEQSNFNKMYQSEYALKEGVLAHYLN
jgi:exopolyphosphatase/guanosine-5'-triphosphate,3'-diphosphate pyrophosphatase